jgi:RNA polymerase sigma-70 factor (ECF subfamily)
LRPSDAELNDPRLVRAVQAGDGAAISRAIELCIPLLRTVVCGRLGLSAEECEDILQEVRIAFLEAGPRFRAHCSLRTYLVRITCRLCAAHLRARGRHGPEPRPLEEARGIAVDHQALAAVLDRLSVDGALDHLSERERLLLDLFYVQGKSYKEIAAEMGIAIGTVARMKSDALAKLRRAI